MFVNEYMNNLLSQILSPFLSAVAGAIIYHYVDKIKTRKKLKRALISELETNLRILKKQKEKIADNLNIVWEEALASVYHAETFHSLRNLDPEFYLKIVKNTPIVEAYQLLFLLNDFRQSKILSWGIFSDLGNLDLNSIVEKEKFLDFLTKAQELIVLSLDKLRKL